MVRNYFITALRSLRRNKTFAFINILGLVLGISGTVVIYRIISFEQSFDTYHQSVDQIYRMALHQESAGGINKDISVQHPLGVALRNDFPDATISRIHWYTPGIFKVSNDQDVARKLRITDEMAFVENEFFSIFDFNVLAGNPEHLLDEPNTIAISVSMANKLFDLKGDDYHSVLGKTVQFENKLTLRVTGVYQDPPKNTDFNIHALMEYQGAKIYPYAAELTSWRTRNGDARCYMKLSPNRTEEATEKELREVTPKYMSSKTSNNYFALQPLRDIHMSEEYGGNSALDQSTISSLKMIAAILILTAVINFINLATAQSVRRAKEIGIRKVLGGRKGHVMIQFLGEVFIITCIAVVISLGISEGALMKLEPFLGNDLSLNILSEPSTALFLLILVVGVTFLAGFYPALVLSRYNPVDAIKNSTLTLQKGKGLSLRRGLVVLQFLISQTLIIGTLVVVFQMDFMKSQPVGFQKDNILTFPIPDNKKENLDLLRSRLASMSAVEGASFYIASPGGARSNNRGSVRYREAEGSFRVNRKNVDGKYAQVFDLQILAGEFFKDDSPSDHAVINRKFAEKLDYVDPSEAVGQRYKTSGGKSYLIVGVVENFHNRALSAELEAIHMMNGPTQYFEAGVRISPQSDVSPIISQVEDIWNSIFTEDVFVHKFLDDNIAAEYEREERVSQLFQVFAGMAIFICCLGLYGLISFMANQKVKEIGIRKVLGATVSSIVMIFSKEVVMLVGLAFVLAAPLTYYVMDGWLSNYFYRIDIGAAIFIIGIAATAIIAMLTVGSRAFKAASANPVESLRDE